MDTGIKLEERTDTGVGNGKNGVNGGSASPPSTLVTIPPGTPPLTRRHVLKRPPVDIEFSDLTYVVPVGRNGHKMILRSISGLFKSGELTAILGPSGAGKSTLLNVLAGYKTQDATGAIYVNGRPRDMKQFRKLSRYIMQEDLLQPGITVVESIRIAADLKLGNTLSRKEKSETVEEIMSLLSLARCRNTLTTLLSGGERKRLSIALELVNNPPVIFLDEPTTGLDDVSSAQCITLMKALAAEGRTVICSIHTPSARLFAMFDHVYIVSEGQCVFAGQNQHIVPFLAQHDLYCPKHYNPADFMIEVSSGEYGNFTEKLSKTVDNGRCFRWNQENQSSSIRRPLGRDDRGPRKTYESHSKHLYDFDSSSWSQFLILLNRMILQHRRNKGYLLLKAVMFVFVSLIIGGMFFQMGNDGSKTIFNFGFCFVTIIVFLYIPMLPVLLHFPQEVQLLKREYFNRWYSLNAYFFAMIFSRIPLQMMLSTVYIVLAYFLTDQPMEWSRGLKFAAICYLIAITSEGMALTISSRLSIVNSVFVGPCLSVPLMLLAAYGLGDSDHIPILIRLAMYFSYLRYGLEGLTMAIYGDNRAKMMCPTEEMVCELREPRALLKEVGMEDVDYWTDFVALVGIFVLFKLTLYVFLRQRLSSRKSWSALSYVIRFIKSYIEH
ncbi:unnamed protein product [Bemisia tabaci]|uniref:ABC transporter domain-containing protein n=1 Tax=Bemisia tabaci TaxID=7038 RepID=A0A9P0F0Y9_BEMTA|nr:PREDICTED: ATP-binding cassette sub-family G member 4-like isoform X1 [Bemisia tabaci]CAH0387257.1 unnamed protein product [Bemisia tabaci]